MKIAIIHYWLVGKRGGESVLSQFLEYFPDADLFVHVVDSEIIPNCFTDRVKSTTFIQRLPNATKWYQRYLPLMPYALEELDLSKYDLIISSESGPAKGVITSPDSMHICYCHSPMRYLWDAYHLYNKDAGFFKRLIMGYFFHRLRQWDVLSSFRVDYFLSNSVFVSKRIMKYYRRDSAVIHPPVDTMKFEIRSKIEDYYLAAGQLVAYKNVELAVRAFNENGKPLVVIGEGEEYDRLCSIAASNINFLGRVSDEDLKYYFSSCRALIFPGVEDFGIVPVEVMASGRPVIAFKKGGALDYVIDGETGIFFDNPTVESLNQAVEEFENRESEFDPVKIRLFAVDNFDSKVFRRKFLEFVDQVLESHK